MKVKLFIASQSTVNPFCDFFARLANSNDVIYMNDDTYRTHQLISLICWKLEGTELVQKFNLVYLNNSGWMLILSFLDACVISTCK